MKWSMVRICISPKPQKPLIFYCVNCGLRLLRKSDPDMLISSHRTATIFCPDRSSFATTEASLPSR